MRLGILQKMVLCKHAESCSFSTVGAQLFPFSYQFQGEVEMSIDNQNLLFVNIQFLRVNNIYTGYRCTKLHNKVNLAKKMLLSTFQTCQYLPSHKHAVVKGQILPLLPPDSSVQIMYTMQCKVVDAVLCCLPPVFSSTWLLIKDFPVMRRVGHRLARKQLIHRAALC